MLEDLAVVIAESLLALDMHKEQPHHPNPFICIASVLPASSYQMPPSSYVQPRIHTLQQVSTSAVPAHSISRPEHPLLVEEGTGECSSSNLSRQH